jgi:N-methylhydantoinase B/oxoprolinase/acetone carboxylase alpha subunit
MNSTLTRFPLLAEALDELIEEYGFDTVVDAVDELCEEAEGT